jgi:hypothetical protein
MAAPNTAGWNGFIFASIRGSINEANGLSDAHGMDENSAEGNAFRHLFASCSLTRRVGAGEATAATSAHETTAHRKNDGEQRDSDHDAANNKKGIEFASNSANKDQTCESFALQGSRPR